MITNRYLKLTLLSVSVVAGIVIFLFLFISNYNNIIAESIGIVSLLRVIDGLPHISEIGELPSNLSPYGPYYYIFLGNIFKILGIKDSFFVVLFSRVLSLTIIATSILWAIKKIENKKIVSNSAYLFAFSLFIVSLPFESVMIRADWVAFVFELIGVLLVVDNLKKKNLNSQLMLSGIMFGIAPIFKLNVIGFFSGCMLYLFAMRKFKHGILMLFGFVSSLLIGYLIVYFHLGQNFFLHLLHSANYGLVGINGWPVIIESVIVDIILKQIHWWIIFVVAYQQIKSTMPERIIIFWGMASTFILASIFQLKVGAGNNYFISIFFIGTVFVHPFFNWANEWKPPLAESSSKNTILFFLILSIFLRTVLTSSTVGSFSLNNFLNYPVKSLIQNIKETIPEGKIYTNDESMSVHLYPWVVLGPWDELGYTNAKYIHKNYFQTVKRKISEIDFDALVLTGTGCDKKSPSGLLAPQVSINDLELQQFKKICLFRILNR